MTIAKLLYHPIVILTITILGIIFYFSLDTSSKQTQKSSENIAVLEHEINQISQDIINLEEKIEYTQSDEFREKVIRNELLLQKEGEYVLQIQDEAIKNTEENCGINCPECPECRENNSAITPLQAWKELIL